jgi:hypothetical protein
MQLVFYLYLYIICSIVREHFVNIVDAYYLALEQVFDRVIRIKGVDDAKVDFEYRYHMFGSPE